MLAMFPISATSIKIQLANIMLAYIMLPILATSMKICLRMIDNTKFLFTKCFVSNIFFRFTDQR